MMGEEGCALLAPTAQFSRGACKPVLFNTMTQFIYCVLAHDVHGSEKSTWDAPNLGERQDKAVAKGDVLFNQALEQRSIVEGFKGPVQSLRQNGFHPVPI
eukprot:14390981-Ditylum_brightwellii.AAC.1